MNPNKIVFLFSFLLIVFIIVEVQQIFADKDNKILTSAEIKRSIQTKYLGEINNIKLNTKIENKMYIVDLFGQNSIYTLKVDAYSGEILYLNKMENVASESLINFQNEGIATFSSGEKEDGKLVKGKTSLEGISLDCSVKIMKARKS
jgi:hypothetical protein